MKFTGENFSWFCESCSLQNDMLHMVLSQSQQFFFVCCITWILILHSCIIIYYIRNQIIHGVHKETKCLFISVVDAIQVSIMSIEHIPNNLRCYFKSSNSKKTISKNELFFFWKNCFRLSIRVVLYSISSKVNTRSIFYKKQT